MLPLSKEEIERLKTLKLEEYATVLANTTQLIGQGESIIVAKVALAQGVTVSPVLVEIFERDGTTKIMDLRGQLANNMTAFECSIPFLASNGLQIKTTGNVSCVVFYSYGGA